MANTQVPSELIATNAISGTIIADNAITSVHIAQNQVTAVQIPDGSITATQIAADAVGANELAASSVVTASIQDDQVTGDKLANNIQIAGTLGVTGVISPTTHIDMPDDAKIKLGAGDDLEIYHDASHSYIKDTGTGGLRLAGNQVVLRNAADNATLLHAAESGAVNLYYDNSAKLTTASGGVTVTGALSITADGNNAVTFTESSAGIMTIAMNDDFSVDAGGDITLDADGGDIRFKDGGTSIASFKNSGGTFIIKSESSDADIYFNGNDGGSAITAMAIDMSEGGRVGIGTTSPSYPLVVSDGGGLGFEFSPDHAGGGYNMLQNYNRSGSAYVPIRYVASQHEFLNGGSEVARIDSSGNLGIGTASPNSKLEVLDTSGATITLNRNDTTIAVDDLYGGVDFWDADGGGTSAGVTSAIRSYGESAVGASSLRFYTSTSSGGNRSSLTERMRIHYNGYVGIGTDSPAYDLHIYNSGNTDRPELRLESVSSDNNTTTGAALITLYHNDSDNSGIADNTAIGQVRFMGDDKDGGSEHVYAYMQGYMKDPGSGSSRKGRIGIHVRNGGAVDEAFTFAHDGSFGIGDTAPSAKLVVSTGGSTAAQGDTDLLVRHNSATSTTAQVQILAGNAGYSNLYLSDTDAYNVGGFIYNHSSNYLATNVNGSERMRIQSDGKVTIGSVPSTQVADLKVGNNLQLAGDKWALRGNNSNNDLAFEYISGQTAFSDDNVKMVLKGTDGRLGIGTVSPMCLLHVQQYGAPVNDLTMIRLTNGHGLAGSDLSLQDIHIDFEFKDSNSNVVPQARISAHVGDGGNADSVVKEGRGYLTFHCSNTGNDSGEEDPAEHFRIAHDGTLTATDTTIGSNSDERLKKNIQKYSGGLDLINQLQPRTFEWKNTEKKKEGTRRGFVAQEILEIDDYWIDEIGLTKKNDPDYEYIKDTEKVYTSKLNDKDAMYVSAIKEMKATIDALEARITELEG